MFCIFLHLRHFELLLVVDFCIYIIVIHPSDIIIESTNLSSSVDYTHPGSFYTNIPYCSSLYPWKLPVFCSVVETDFPGRPRQEFKHEPPCVRACVRAR